MSRPANIAREIPRRLVTVARRARDLREERLASGMRRDVPAEDWYVDRHLICDGVVIITGWVRSERTVRRVQAVDAGRAFIRAGRVMGSGPDGLLTRSTFRVLFEDDDWVRARDASVRVIFEDGSWAAMPGRTIDPALIADRYHRAVADFFIYATELGGQARVLEVGSRNRTGEVRRNLVAPARFVGIDILPGDNVDVVGDAHELTRHFPPGHFDAAFSISTFEHLAMPWKVVLELNKVLTMGGRVMTASHQTFPLHDEPWDFWRFGSAGWKSLFNPATGFRLLGVDYGEPVSVVAHMPHEVTDELDRKRAFIGSVAVAEKVGDSELRWDVPIEAIGADHYPGPGVPDQGGFLRSRVE